MDLWVPRLNCI